MQRTTNRDIPTAAAAAAVDEWWCDEAGQQCWYAALRGQLLPALYSWQCELSNWSWASGATQLCGAVCMQELEVAYRTLREHFFVIASGEDSMPGIAWVLEKAKAAVIL